MPLGYLKHFSTFFLFTILRFPNPYLIALSLLVVILVGGKVSGGHFNPAVSFTAWTRGTLKAGDLVLYVLAQLIGGLLASMYVYAM